jgi:biopolymer transport protein ExbB
MTVNDAALQPGFAHFLSQADGMAQFILLVLLTMSVASWYLILSRLAQSWSRRRRSRDFLDGFAGSSAPVKADEPFGRLAVTAFRSANRVKESARPEHVSRSLRRALDTEAARLESGLTLLASVASAAPFVGLFGTVWGIYHALLAIGLSGHAGLEQVAGPVGEALLMTAFGLSVAIPAVLAYNAFQRGNRVLQTELDGFAHDLHALLVDGVPLAQEAG